MKGESDTITEYSIQKKDVYGESVKSWKYDYLSISFIRLSTGKKWHSKNVLINMLDTLFSEELDAESKKKILENEHQMEMTRELEGGIDEMCNVSLGIRNRALAEGFEQGIAQGVTEGIEQGIKALINTCRKFKLSKEEIVEEIKNNFSVSAEEAGELVEKYM